MNNNLFFIRNLFYRPYFTKLSLLTTLFFVLYFIFFTKKENFGNEDIFLAKNIKMYLDDNKNVDYKDYLDYIKSIGNTYNGLIMLENYNTLKTLAKLKMLKTKNITDFMT